MVEPEIAENTVPATMAITDSRPGTREMTLSKASMAFMATPVWNSTSPISTKKGIGVSEKLVTEATPLRTTCISPGSPPRNSSAPTRLTPRKAKATGRPRPSSTVSAPNSSVERDPPGHDVAPFGPRSSCRAASSASRPKHSGAGT